VLKSSSPASNTWTGLVQGIEKEALSGVAYNTQHLFLSIEFMINELDDPVDPSQLLQQINLALVTLDDPLVQIVE
jgi:hypothetical protein